MTRYEWKLRQGDKRLLAILLIGAANVSGVTIWKLGRVGAGRVYVVLARLERSGIVTSAWEVVPPTDDRPPRRFYRLTPEGRKWAAGIVRLEVAP